MWLQYLLMAVVVLGMLVVVMILAKNYSPTEWIILAFFLVVILLVGAQYFFGTNVVAILKKVTTKNPQLDIHIEKEKEKEKDKDKDKDKDKENGDSGMNMQVFHVPGQYNYTDAKALCRAYGGSLANIDQMNEAFKNGAEWCDYGWSEDQMALFPTQKETWQKFNESEFNKQDCGRPGINGGYTMDLNHLLGANCFGPKPKQKDDKLQVPPFPKDPVDEEAEKFKGNLPNVSSFNYQKWDQ